MKLGYFRSVVAIFMALLLPLIRGQMGPMGIYNNMYDAQQQEASEYCQEQGGYGSARNCGYGTRGQNWFGSYKLGKANPYNFVSTMPYGYGSGAMPFFSDPYSGGWQGTSYGPGGYMASSLPMQQQPNYNNYPPQPPVNMYRPNDVYY